MPSHYNIHSTSSIFSIVVWKNVENLQNILATTTLSLSVSLAVSLDL